MYTFTIPRERFDELNPDKQMIRQLISKHISMVSRLKKNMAYYEGQHEILNDSGRENKLVCNHARDISDTASSYFIGNPVSYKSENDITDLTDALELAGADEVDGAKAEYLTRTFDESGVEILKKAIEQDIHKFSHIPCMTDESFGGNVSGVAMEFKLLGMENITKIKTRYYRKGLRKRIRIFCNFLSLYGKSVDPTGITMTFTRALPKNLLEISQIVSNLWGKVSRKTLLSQVPFVDNVDDELKALDEETEENLKRQQEMFGMQGNTPPDQTGKEEEEKASKKKKDNVDEE